MSNQKDEQLSSHLTFLRIYFNLAISVVALITILVFSLVVKFYNPMIPGIVIAVILLAVSSYRLIFSSDAAIVGRQLALKKKFQPLKLYDFNKIHSVKKTLNKTTENITLKMENEDGTIEKFMIQCYASPDRGPNELVSDLLLDLRNGINN